MSSLRQNTRVLHGFFDGVLIPNKRGRLLPVLNDVEILHQRFTPEGFRSSGATFPKGLELIELIVESFALVGGGSFRLENVGEDREALTVNFESSFNGNALNNTVIQR